MANYTMTVYDIESNKYIWPNGVFDFNYDFYTDDPAIKALFEKQFLEYYQFHEIGFETVYRFQLALKAHLDVNADYWSKLYQTELRSQELDFMTNKDYTETIERVLDQDTTNKNTNNSTSNSTNAVTNESSSNSTDAGTSTVNSNTTSTSSGSGTSNINSKGSDTNNGVAYISTDNGSLTTASVSDSTNTNTANSSIANTNEATTSNTNETTNNSTSNSTSSNTSHGTSNDVGTNDEKETTKIHGIGNIGVTSSADLLTGWRSVLISMNLLVIESCKDLFMQIY